jgi:hypothetical protein
MNKTKIRYANQKNNDFIDVCLHLLVRHGTTVVGELVQMYAH